MFGLYGFCYTAENIYRNFPQVNLMINTKIYAVGYFLSHVLLKFLLAVSSRYKRAFFPLKNYERAPLGQVYFCNIFRLLLIKQILGKKNYRGQRPKPDTFLGYNNPWHLTPSTVL